jgi:hypothetical protein
MFRRRQLRSIAMVALLSGLLGASLAQAQPLGFTINPTQGFPGDTVTGQVNPSDVAASCVTDVAGLQAEFEAVFTGPFAGGGTTGDLFNMFFPSGEFVFENHNQLAYSLTGLTVLGIASNIGGAAETALPQTFVMTFADLATQQPLGPLGHFDPVTGMGSVVVPNLAPGRYPVVATCVRPTLDVNTLAAGIQKNGAFLQSIGAPVDPNSPEFAQFVENLLGPGADLFAFLNAIGPTLIQNIVVPGPLGIQFFTILQHLGHFQCYGLRNAPSENIPVTLDNHFGSLAVTVRKARALCAPAIKNGEPPPGSVEGAFLTDYSITRGGPAARVPGQTVVNQFGTLTVDVLTPRSLLVPTAYSDTGPPSPTGAFLDHFTCYDVRTTNGTPRFPGATVTVETTLETATIQVQRPRRLCVPTDKNGEDPTAPSFPESLLCYQTKGKGSVSGTAFLNNQFGQQVYRLGNRQQLCVPSQLNPPPTTTTTSTTSTTSTTASTTSTTESTTSTTETTTSTTESTTSTTETTTSTTETTTTSGPTTTTTSSTTTTTMASPSGAFLDATPSARE